MSIIKIIAEGLVIPEERLSREALREWIERKLLLVESEIKEILLRHGVGDIIELEERVKKGEIEEHPGMGGPHNIREPDQREE